MEYLIYKNIFHFSAVYIDDNDWREEIFNNASTLFCKHGVKKCKYCEELYTIVRSNGGSRDGEYLSTDIPGPW